jgi:hypothetical protein
MLALDFNEGETRPHRTRQLCALLVAALFVIASYAVQTHIHGAGQNLGRGHTAHIVAQPDAPTGGDVADCPLCQQATSSGSLLVPTTEALLAPSDFFWRTSYWSAPVAKRAPAVGWTGRGPPH